MGAKKAMTVEMVPITHVTPNPYRHIEKYNLSEEKIESLIKSYANTGFWDGSIQARPHPTRIGYFEIAFGHHRIEAAKRAGIKEIGLVVSARTNDEMFKMMADENREEFKSDPVVSIQTIASLIDAYAKGEVTLEEPRGDGKGVSVFTLPGGKVYNLATVARFLNWTKKSDGQATDKCRIAFEAYMEHDVAEAVETIPQQFRNQAAVEKVSIAVRAARHRSEKKGLSKAKREAAEKKAAHNAARIVKEEKGFKGKDARQIGFDAVDEIVPPPPPQPVAPPPVERYVAEIINRSKIIEPYAQITLDCRELLPFIDDIDPALCADVASALEKMLERTSANIRKLVAALHRGNPTSLRRLLEENTNAAYN